MEKACTACRATLGDMVKRHTAHKCPLAAGSYCGLCASYGHSPSNCPDIHTAAYREPHLLEQLLPATVLEEYNIRTRTPLQDCPVAALPSKEEVWEIPETDESLRAALNTLGVKPMICQEKGRKEARESTENKKRLQKAADAKGIKIVYISSGSTAKKPAAK
jgi:hypothetical protein